MSTRRTNIRSAVLGGGVCLVLILVIAIVSGDPASDLALERPSTFFTDATGARASYLVLEQVSPRVERWRRPLSDLAFLPEPPPSTMVVMGPVRGLSNAEADALDRWITSGGQLILASDAPWPVGPLRGMDDGDGDVERGGGRDDDDGVPDVIERIVDRPDYHARHGIEVDVDVDVGDAVARARIVPVGAGRIVHVPNPHAFSNAALRDTDNAVWLVGQCSGWGGAVRFDEYHHGFGQRQDMRAIAAAFLMTPWGFACLQLALAGAVYILGARRRFGRPIDPMPPERTSALETVDALGALFEAAQARRFSARAMHQYVSARLSATLSRPIDLMSPDERRRAAERLGVSDTDLETYAGNVQGLIAGADTSDEKLVETAAQASHLRSWSHGKHGSGGDSFAAR